MKRLSFVVLTLTIVFLSPAYANAWFWSKNEQQGRPHSTPKYSLGMMDSGKYFGAGIKTAAQDIHVICATCPQTNLQRTLKPVEIAINLGASGTIPEPGVKNPQDTDAEKPESRKELAPLTQAAPPEEKRIVDPAAQDTPVPADIGPCMASPIFFEFDRYDLAGAEKLKLQEALGRLKNETNISVKGYTCDIGTQGYNDALAYKRAQTVASILKSHNVNVSSVSGQGKCCFMSDRKEQNRRVEIICIK